MAASRNWGAYDKGFGLLQRSLGVIYGRFSV